MAHSTRTARVWRRLEMSISIMYIRHLYIC